MEPDDAICAAFETLARADADAAYWMQQYKRCVQDVRNWVETTQIEEPEAAPQYRLLQQTLQDTRYGLDYAIRCASDARQELSSARQFYLAARTNIPASAASSTPSVATITAESFRIRPSASPPSSLAQPIAPVRRSLSAGSDVDPRRPVSSLIQSGMNTEGASTVSPLKRAGAETMYLLPAKRAKYPRAFKWDDNMMHHFPKDFTLPVCPLLTMWTYWVCGDEIAKYPPFRILIASELEDVKTKRTLSSLRFVMLEIESRVLAQGAWVNNPSPRDAAEMLERVKASIAARPAAKRGELQPVEQLQWTSLGRILRDQKKLRGEEEDDDEFMNSIAMGPNVDEFIVLAQKKTLLQMNARPVLTTAFVVGREGLSAHGVELLSHVVNHLDEYLNTFSYHWTVSRACKAGLSRRGLEYLAARDPNWVDGDDAALVAVKKNFLHVLQWLNECYPDRTSWGNRQARCFMNIAAEKGHFEILQWLHTNRNEGCTTFALNIAASKGNLPMVQWLHQNRNEKCTKQAMDDAAENGHLAVVEWLHRNRSEGCSEIAMDVSAANGHLDVLRFLHENRREGCTSAALTMAATRGHLEVVKWLCTNRTEGQPATALCAAAESGHLAVTEYLYEVVRGRQRRSESTIRKAARSAMEAGHAAVAEQLEQKLKRQRLE